MRAFITIGAAVALFWGVAVFVMGQSYAGTAPGAPCRDELLLLSVNRNLGTINIIQREGRDLAVNVDHRSWMELDSKRKRGIAMAAWCVQALDNNDGAVLVKSGMDVIGRVDNGVWSSDFGS